MIKERVLRCENNIVLTTSRKNFEVEGYCADKHLNIDIVGMNDEP
jgi:hypothetical protein